MKYKEHRVVLGETTHVIKEPDWKVAVREILAAGYSEAELAKFIGLEQSTINRIKHGQRPRGPSWAVGQKILHIHSKVRGDSRVSRKVA